MSPNHARRYLYSWYYTRKLPLYPSLLRHQLTDQPLRQIFVRVCLKSVRIWKNTLFQQNGGKVELSILGLAVPWIMQLPSAIAIITPPLTTWYEQLLTPPLCESSPSTIPNGSDLKTIPIFNLYDYVKLGADSTVCIYRVRSYVNSR